MIYRYCGSNKPASVTSPTDSPLLLLFKSDSSGTGSGFTIFYEPHQQEEQTVGMLC